MTTGSSRLDRYATGRLHGPSACVRTLCAVRVFSCTKRLKSLVTSGSPNAGALVKSLFISSKAFSYSGPHSRGSLSDPAVALNKGLAISEKASIQIWQNPATPRNSRTSFLVFSQGIEQMACFLSCPSTQCPFEMLTHFPSVCLSAWVSANGSAHYADHPCGKASALDQIRGT